MSIAAGRGSAADCPYCPFLGPSRSAFRLTLWYGHLTGCPSNSRGLITPVTGRRSLRLRSVVKVRDLSHAQTEDTRLTARGPSRSSGRTARSRTRSRSLLLLTAGAAGPVVSAGLLHSHAGSEPYLRLKRGAACMVVEPSRRLTAGGLGCWLPLWPLSGLTASRAFTLGLSPRVVAPSGGTGFPAILAVIH
jgi:hypothetical protein